MLFLKILTAGAITLGTIMGYLFMGSPAANAATSSIDVVDSTNGLTVVGGSSSPEPGQPIVLDFAIPNGASWYVEPTSGPSGLGCADLNGLRWSCKPSRASWTGNVSFVAYDINNGYAEVGSAVVRVAYAATAPTPTATPSPSPSTPVLPPASISTLSTYFDAFWAALGGIFYVVFPLAIPILVAVIAVNWGTRWFRRQVGG